MKRAIIILLLATLSLTFFSSCNKTKELIEFSEDDFTITLSMHSTVYDESNTPSGTVLIEYIGEKEDIVFCYYTQPSSISFFKDDEYQYSKGFGRGVLALGGTGAQESQDIIESFVGYIEFEMTEADTQYVMRDEAPGEYTVSFSFSLYPEANWENHISLDTPIITITIA